MNHRISLLWIWESFSDKHKTGLYEDAVGEGTTMDRPGSPKLKTKFRDNLHTWESKHKSTSKTLNSEWIHFTQFIGLPNWMWKFALRKKGLKETLSWQGPVAYEMTVWELKEICFFTSISTFAFFDKSWKSFVLLDECEQWSTLSYLATWELLHLIWFGKEIWEHSW